MFFLTTNIFLISKCSCTDRCWHYFSECVVIQTAAAIYSVIQQLFQQWVCREPKKSPSGKPLFRNHPFDFILVSNWGQGGTAPIFPACSCPWNIQEVQEPCTLLSEIYKRHLLKMEHYKLIKKNKGAIIVPLNYWIRLIYNE